MSFLSNKFTKASWGSIIERKKRNDVILQINIIQKLRYWTINESEILFRLGHSWTRVTGMWWDQAAWPECPRQARMLTTTWNENSVEGRWGVGLKYTLKGARITWIPDSITEWRQQLRYVKRKWDNPDFLRVLLGCSIPVLAIVLHYLLFIKCCFLVLRCKSWISFQ